MISSLLYLLLSYIINPVLGHGYILDVTVNGVKHIGFPPGSPNRETPVWVIRTPEPVTDVNSSDMGCGPGAVAGSSSIPLEGPSDLIVSWASGEEDGLWPHDTGPILDYITACGESCGSLDPSTAGWIKVGQLGRDASTLWVQKQLELGNPVTVKIPALPDGEYVLRHEIIALHNAGQPKGAEYYPGCIRFIMSGGQFQGALPSDTVRFPGAYRADDPGILTEDQFNADVDYPFPGPPVFDPTAQGGTVSVQGSGLAMLASISWVNLFVVLAAFSLL